MNLNRKKLVIYFSGCNQIFDSQQSTMSYHPTIFHDMLHCRRRTTCGFCRCGLAQFGHRIISDGNKENQVFGHHDSLICIQMRTENTQKLCSCFTYWSNYLKKKIINISNPLWCTHVKQLRKLSSTRTNHKSSHTENGQWGKDNQGILNEVPWHLKIHHMVCTCVTRGNRDWPPHKTLWTKFSP